MFNNLPVPADRLIQTMYQIDVNRPPFVPALDLPQQVQPFAAYIAGMFALEVQNNAQSNNMRVFMFNLCANNNWQNAEFAENVAAAADYILLGLARQQFHDIQTAVVKSIPGIVEMITAANCRTYPKLQDYVTDPNAQAAVTQLITQFTNVGNEIAKMKQMVATRSAPRGASYHAASTAGQSQPSLFQGGSQAATPGFRSGSRSGRWARNQGPEEVTMEPQRQQQQADALRSPFNSRQPRAAVERDVTPQKPQVIDMVPAELRDHPFLIVDQKSSSYLIPAIDSVVDWVPTVNQPYVPAYKPSIHALYHQVFSDGQVAIVIKELPDAMMDWENHDPEGRIFGTRSRVQPRGNSERLWRDVEALNHADIQTSNDVPGEGEAAQEVIPVQICPRHHIATSRQALMVDVRLSYMAMLASTDNDILAYEAYGSIYSVSVDKRDCSDVVQKLANVTEYSILAQKLKGIKGDISDILWYTIDDLLTKAVTRVLHQSLSLDITPDRFSDDIEEVITVVGSYGPLLLEMFLKYQAEVIRTTLGLAIEEDRVAMDEALDMESHPELKATYVGENYSVTVLDCMSHDLEVELDPVLGAAITIGLTPEIHGLVKGIFDRADELEREFTRHLIVTNDLVVMEVAKGHIGEGFFSLTVV